MAGVMATDIPPTGADNDPARWEDHWSRFAEATRLNPAQGYRRDTILRLLGADAGDAGAHILDIGCGAGDLLVAIGRRFPAAALAGVDRSKSGFRAARAALPAVMLIDHDLEADTPAPTSLAGWASHAVCSEVLEHVADPVDVLRRARLLLAPGGRLVVTVPGGPKSAFDKAIGHRRHYTPELLGAQLRAAGYQVELVSGAGFPIFNLYRLVVISRGDRLADDIDGRPSALARVAMAVFRGLFRFALADTPWGWQIVAQARRTASDQRSTL